MPQLDAPLRRSIGLSGVVRFLIAGAAAIAVGAAFAAGNSVLAIACLIFLIVAVALAHRAASARKEAGPSVSTHETRP